MTIGLKTGTTAISFTLYHNALKKLYLNYIDFILSENGTRFTNPTPTFLQLSVRLLE